VGILNLCAKVNKFKFIRNIFSFNTFDLLQNTSWSVNKLCQKEFLTSSLLCFAFFLYLPCVLLLNNHDVIYGWPLVVQILWELSLKLWREWNPYLAQNTFYRTSKKSIKAFAQIKDGAAAAAATQQDEWVINQLSINLSFERDLLTLFLRRNQENPTVLWPPTYPFRVTGSKSISRLTFGTKRINWRNIIKDFMFKSKCVFVFVQIVTA